MIGLVISIAVVVGFIACGCYMTYSAITGKGIPHPGKNALFQLKVQYYLRGLIGVAFIIIGIVLTISIYNSY